MASSGPRGSCNVRCQVHDDLPHWHRAVIAACRDAAQLVLLPDLVSQLDIRDMRVRFAGTLDAFDLAVKDNGDGLRIARFDDDRPASVLDALGPGVGSSCRAWTWPVVCVWSVVRLDLKADAGMVNDQPRDSDLYLTVIEYRHGYSSIPVSIASSGIIVAPRQLFRTLPAPPGRVCFEQLHGLIYR